MSKMRILCIHERSVIQCVTLQAIADSVWQAIETLARHSFDTNSLTTAREALRCLANIFLLKPPTRQIFVDLGFGPKAAERLKVGGVFYARATGLTPEQVDNRDDEFLISRILFLMTYDTNLNFEKLVHENQLDDSINAVSCTLRCWNRTLIATEHCSSCQTLLQIKSQSFDARPHE